MSERTTLLEYETEVHNLYQDGFATGICQYDRRLFTVEELMAMENLHSEPARLKPLFADDAVRITRTRGPSGLRIEGEIDSSNLDALARALGVALADPGDVHLDLSALQFVDVAGVRAIVSASRALNRDRRMVLHGIAPHLMNVMQIVGWSRLPNLVLATGVATGGEEMEQ